MASKESKFDRVKTSIKGTGKKVLGKVGRVLDKTVGRGIDAMLRDDSIRTSPISNAEKRFNAKKFKKVNDIIPKVSTSTIKKIYKKK